MSARSSTKRVRCGIVGLSVKTWIGTDSAGHYMGSEGRGAHQENKILLHYIKMSSLKSHAIENWVWNSHVH